jgi:sec-independent protein translocase protein TatA
MVAAAGPFGLGAPELLIILAVVVIIFGGARLADLGGSMGKGIREFKKNVKDNEEEDEVKPGTKNEPAPIQHIEPVNRPTEEEAAVTNNLGASVQALQCPTCGALNPANAKICNQCGTALGAPVT